uniref:Immunoglobulin V-set domain-containing protein n=1 Tax=Cyprinus carpio carpio TaxID=630221 RepID=A0A9J8B7M9_CYPCA
MEIQRNSRILNHLQKSFVLYSLLYENTQGIILLSLLLLGGVCNAETEEKMPVMEGDSVTLHTNLSEILDKDTILWGFGPRELIISQITRKEDLTSFFVTDEVSFAGRLQVDQQTGSLTIRNIRNRHSGQYKLTISREKTRYRIFHVHVFDVAGKKDGVKSVSVNEGESVVLQNDAAELQKDDLLIWRTEHAGLYEVQIRGRGSSKQFLVSVRGEFQIKGL